MFVLLYLYQMCSDSEQNIVSKADPNRAPSLARVRLEQIEGFEAYIFRDGVSIN